MAAGMPALRRSVKIDANGNTKVDIKAKVTGVLLQRIATLGGTVINSFPQFNAIQANMPISQIQKLAAEADVVFIREAIPPMLNKTNTSEGDVAHTADLARTAFSVNGAGVKVGVLSDSASAARLTALQASGDLPGVTVVASATGTDEGAAMLEIVHDLAPGAQLYFATAIGGEATFATNIQALATAGCDVIVDDIGYLTEPVFQDGIVAQAVDTVAASGVAYFSSAGNSGNLNDGTSGVWEGDFSSTAAPGAIGSGNAHDFGGGLNYVTITGDSPSYFTLQWSDPSGGSSNDYDLYLMNSALTTVYDSSTIVQSGTQDPLEYINSGPYNDVGNKLVIIKKTGEAARYLHLNTNRGRLSAGTAGQTSAHSCANGSFGVAAVDATTAHGAGGVFNASETIETFSSDGPRRVFFNGAGTAYTPGNFLATGGQLRQKPDLTAADGVACATPGFNPFYGTSAAAPHAAAIAALLISQGSATTPAGIRQAFANSSLDIEAAGVDRDSGVGIVMANAALTYAATYTLTYMAGANGSITGDSPQTINHGSDGAEVTAVPAANYHFVKWSDDVMTASRTDTN
ncbi:S8 family serine peptidase, partial [Candidatus Sumerlaeota bacterium]